MAESDEVYIKNPNNDFAMIQNYVIQLVAEKKITASAMVLYAFYQSLNGFSEIHVGYRYIKENTGLSMGTIKKCNELLVENNLIKINKHGPNSNFIIDLIPNNLLPRRVLKAPIRENLECSSDEEILSDEKCSSDEQENHQMNTLSEKCSPDEQIYIIQPDISNINNTTTTSEQKKPVRKSNLAKIKEIHTPDKKKKKETIETGMVYSAKEALFIDEFVKAWMKYCKSKYYTKKDFSLVKQIGDIDDARKYIPVLWNLDDVDKWVKNSDHTISVFVKEYKSGRLQAMYPNTIYSMG